MAEYIAIPKLGMTMTEATLVEWKVAEGDHVNKGDVVLVIQTEKTLWDVQAAASGFVHILVQQDVKAAVGRVVGLIAATKEELEQLQKEPPKELYTTGAAPPARAPAAAGAGAAAPPRAPGERVAVSPLARKLAEEHGIDVTAIAGTGPGGRIIREDVEAAIEARAREIEIAYQGRRVKGKTPLRGMRAAIAEHMQRSLAVSAQLTSMGEIDATELVKARNELVKREADLGVRISYTDILIVAAARALLDNPIVNSSIINNELVTWEDINIGMAVALEEGLIVPVIRDADKKSLIEISREASSLAEKARSGALLPDDVAAGTFTITNLGAFGGGWGFGTPIINQPQSAILGTGAIVERAIVRDGQVVAAPVMTYSFTFDHRVIDGLPAARFMARLTELLENPKLLPLDV
ncbi:MAG: dihydrolipoamide acetyltransferase family protein [Dehalococcoidia bacterium]|nr:dihydrolipoamide acetyltransferase family protein [Dehalococcoidia bacterium]